MKEQYLAWCKEFMFKPKQELSREAFFGYMTCSLREMDGSIGDLYEELKGEFLIQLMEKREKVMGLELSKAVRIWFASTCNSPGIAVMYMAILRQAQVDRNIQVIDMEKLGNVFPNGFLFEEDLHEMWDKQKIGGINMLDDFNIYRG